MKSVSSMPRNAEVMPTSTEPVQYCACEPNHSQNSGCGPHTETHRIVSTSRRNAANALSALRRAPSDGFVPTGKRIGRVPGRRPTNRPPVSVGSLLATPYTLGGLAVELLHFPREFLVNDVPLHLERRRQLAGRLREILREDLELLDLLDPADLRVHLVDDALHLLAHRLGARHLVRLEAVLLREAGDLVRVDRDQRDQVRPPVADHHRL